MRRIAILAAALWAGCAGEEGGPWLTAPTLEQHGARWFPIAAGSVHAVATCDDCHGAFDTFARYDCLHCHTGDHVDEAALGTRHAAVASYRFASDACYGCHRDGIGVDHAAIFPISTGPHAVVQCAQCHVDPADRSVLGCAGCHPHDQAKMADVHSGVSGYTFESSRCLACHPKGTREGGL